MKHIKFFVIAVMAICLAACGGKKDPEEKGNEEITLTPETTKVRGDLREYFKVVDKEYTVTKEFGDLVSIEVERTDVDFDFDLTDIEPFGTFGPGVRGNVGFGIEILDEKGNVIEKCAATASGLSGMYSSGDMKEAMALKPGESSTVRWSFHFKEDGPKPAKFRLTSALQENWEAGASTGGNSDGDGDSDDYSSSFDGDDSYSASSPSSNSHDWDALLDSYEEYVDEYVALAKKASKGDMSALEKYPQLLEKAQKFSDKCENVRDDMSSAQAARYMRITNKMASAIL